MASDFEDLDEDAYLYGGGSKEEEPKDHEMAEDIHAPPDNVGSELENLAKRPREISDNDEDEDESESDDDSIVFLLGPDGSSAYSSRAAAPAVAAPPPLTATSSETVATQTASSEPVPLTDEKSPVAAIDLDKVPEYNGKPITQTNIEELEEKPWRRMGADITDYFNYGFDEFSWIAYCNKQDNMRANNNTQPSMPMFTPMMMPPMMGMPGMFPQMQRR